MRLRSPIRSGRARCKSSPSRSTASTETVFSSSACRIRSDHARHAGGRSPRCASARRPRRPCLGWFSCPFRSPSICGASLSFQAPDAVMAITKLTIVRTSTRQLPGWRYRWDEVRRLVKVQEPGGTGGERAAEGDCPFTHPAAQPVIVGRFPSAGRHTSLFALRVKLGLRSSFRNILFANHIM